MRFNLNPLICLRGGNPFSRDRGGRFNAIGGNGRFHNRVRFIGGSIGGIPLEIANFQFGR